MGGAALATASALLHNWLLVPTAFPQSDPLLQLTLDIIGKAVFNYDFNSLTSDSPLIQVGYRGAEGWKRLEARRGLQVGGS